MKGIKVCLNYATESDDLLKNHASRSVMKCNDGKMAVRSKNKPEWKELRWKLIFLPIPIPIGYVVNVRLIADEIS